MSFARRQLEKFGWKEGEGLGKNKDGISKAISLGVKNDTDGLGAKANEWSSTWWDSIFNKVSSKITIESNNDGDVALVKEGHAVVGKEKELVHGAFIISGENAAFEDDDKKDYSIKISDKELFEICEGRSARKGARGEQVGKLVRTSQSIITTSQVTVSKKAKKSKSKDKKSKKKKSKDKEETKLKKKRKRDHCE